EKHQTGAMLFTVVKPLHLLKDASHLKVRPSHQRLRSSRISSICIKVYGMGMLFSWTLSIRKPRMT
ncbi:hypothetical protein, partial [Pseudomonas viridiflava]|uniref:hypothetical protein n=1 Tax=Pseudomonas viridiflava TaxID=33069 RepID=UPI001981C2E1